MSSVMERATLARYAHTKLKEINEMRAQSSRKNLFIVLGAFIIYYVAGIAFYCGSADYTWLDATYFIVVTFLTIG